MFAGCSCFEGDASLEHYFGLLCFNGVLLAEQVGTAGAWEQVCTWVGYCTRAELALLLSPLGVGCSG